MEYRNRDTILNGLFQQNPVFIHTLGLCPALAVTNSVKNAIALGMATIFVLAGSNSLISMIRHIVPRQVRIATFIAVIATFVTVADYLVRAITLSVYREFGPFISLIVANCVILARAELFASRNPLGKSFLDGLGNGIGFAVALLSLGAIREVLGAGTFLGFSLFGPYFEPWVLFLLPPGGFIALAIWLLLFNAYRLWRTRGQSAAPESVKIAVAR